MTDIENREALIEEAAKAMFLRQNPNSRWEMLPADDMYRVEWMEDARAALAVFEAHAKELATSPEPVKNGADSLHDTPTDDERFAKSFGGWDPDEVARNPRAAAEVIERLRTRLIEEFRRPVSPEPSDPEGEGSSPWREIQDAKDLLTEAYGPGGWVAEPQTEPTCTHPHHGKRLHECELPPIDEPQTEPTDAQVLAAVDAFMASQIGSEDGPSLVHKNMAAALRAAAATRGENR